jgi:Kef-type K+ transport system membrane component KefB
MDMGGITFTFAAVFVGAAVLASIALYTRQPIVIAYIVLGVVLGPQATGLIKSPDLVADAGRIGIILLLFLLGLDMQPRSLFRSLKQSAFVAVTSSIGFFLFAYLATRLFGFSHNDSLVAGAALMFSSTIIGIKLLPTTVLHHRHLGELLVALLLFQDLIAILALVFLQSASTTGTDPLAIAVPFMLLPVLIVSCWLAVRYVLLPLISAFDRFHEYIFLVSIGWCLGVAEAAAAIGLSAEIGAFIGGITVATSPIAQYIAISLKPLRDFFLVIFFFSVGVQFDLSQLPAVMVPALIIAGLLLALKPLTYYILLRGISETPKLAWNLGFRLGQCSEFALLIGYVATTTGWLTGEGQTLIQAVTILTLVLSSYIVVFNYPTPIAISDRLRRD